MIQYIAKRLVQLIAVLFGVTFLTFMITQAAPSDAAQMQYISMGTIPSEELLEQTRYSYQESGIPAIHPRYRASYSELYGEEEAEQGSLGIRTFICMILFAVFVFMQNERKDILHISSTKVVQEVSKNADITDVWKKIP